MYHFLFRNFFLKFNLHYLYSRNAYPNPSTFYQECKQQCQLWTPSSKHQQKTPWAELDCYLSNYIPFLGTRGCKRANWWPQLHIVFTCIALTHRRIATFLKMFLQNNFPRERSINSAVIIKNSNQTHQFLSHCNLLLMNITTTTTTIWLVFMHICLYCHPLDFSVLRPFLEYAE